MSVIDTDETKSQGSLTPNPCAFPSPYYLLSWLFYRAGEWKALALHTNVLVLLIGPDGSFQSEGNFI